MDYWNSSVATNSSSGLPAHLADMEEQEQQNNAFRMSHHHQSTNSLFDDLPAPPQPSPSQQQQDLSSVYGLYGQDDQNDVYRRLHQQQKPRNTNPMPAPATTNYHHHHHRNQATYTASPSSNLLMPSTQQQQQIQIPVGTQSISIQVEGNPTAPTGGGVRRDHTLTAAAQQALRQAASELATSPTKGTRRWLMPLLVMFALFMAAALAFASISLFGNQKDLRDRISFQESQLKRMEEHIQKQEQQHTNAQSKRDNLGIFNHESDKDDDDNKLSGTPSDRLHEQIYEFVLPQQQSLPRAGEMIAIPSDSSNSIPGLDIELIVSYDVCCHLDDSMSCARGMDVSRSVPSMSASLQRQSERQFLALRISTNVGYAGKQCTLRFTQR